MSAIPRTIWKRILNAMLVETQQKRLFLLAPDLEKVLMECRNELAGGNHDFEEMFAVGQAFGELYRINAERLRKPGWKH